MSESLWLTAAEAASIVKRGRRFVIREAKAGRLRAARIGGRGELLTCHAWLTEWVEAQAQPVTLSVARRRA